MSKRRRYEDAVQRFRIEDEIARLHGNPTTGINAYVECCGRYTGENRLALRAISASGELREFSFDDLADMSGRAAKGTLPQEPAPDPFEVQPITRR